MAGDGDGGGGGCHGCFLGGLICLVPGWYCAADNLALG